MQTLLYKYRGIGNLNTKEMNKYTQSILENGELFFCDPKEFNDPFDSKFIFILDGSKKDIMRNMKEKGKSQKWIEHVISNYSREQIFDLFFRNINERLDLVRVFCVSENHNNILMWSHYSQNHYGICIGIKAYEYGGTINIRIRGGQVLPILAHYDPQYLPAVNVVYTNERPKPHNVRDDSDKQFNRFVLTKAKDWEYEQERRIILPSSLFIKNPVKITRSQIAEVIFGLKTPNDMMEKVIAITKDIKDIKYYRMIDEQKKFELVRKEIS